MTAILRSFLREENLRVSNEWMQHSYRIVANSSIQSTFIQRLTFSLEFADSCLTASFGRRFTIAQDATLERARSKARY
jgi:hypothetical protein